MTSVLPEHLSYWQTNLDLQDFKEFCGDYNSPFKQEAREHVIKKGYDSILDVGAGVFSEYYGFKDAGYDIDYTATDITPKYVEYGKERGINVVQCHLESMPFEENSFECCYCFDVLNHQVEYETGIRELLRVTEKEVIISFFKGFEEQAILGNRYRVAQEHLHRLAALSTLESISGDPKPASTANAQLDALDAAREEWVDALASLRDAHPDSDNQRIIQYSGRYPIEKTPHGLLERRVVLDDKNVCLYSFFNKEKMIKFLGDLKVDYRFHGAPDGKIMLHLVKK